MPKLLHINTTLNTGSTGRIAEQILKMASADGWECYYAHGGRYVGKSEFHSIQVSSKWDNYLHAAEGEFLGRHGLGSVNATKRFVETLKEIKPDIIHLHNIHGYYINYKILFEYLSEAKIPIVWTLHDCWSFTGHCTHFDNAGCRKWESCCAHCPLLMAQYKSRLIDRSRKNFLLKKDLYSNIENMTIVPVSNWLGQFLPDSILKAFPMRTIHNGIDLNVFRPTENSIRERYGIPEDKTIVLGVLGSGFDVEKGRKEFIALANQEQYQIITVGVSSKQAKELPDNIIVVSRTTNQHELADFYTAADVLLNPTYNDTFPTINLEALACGTPIVTYCTGGSPEAIDEKTGIVVKKGDIRGLIDAIDEVKRKGKKHYSEACRLRAESLFDKDKCYKAYLELYSSLL